MSEEARIIPTVGRSVYYKSYGTPGGEYPSTDRAAIITEIVDVEKDIVSLCVFNPEGMFFNRNVQRGQEGGQWDWMKYQKGQAKKTEEVEGKLAEEKKAPKTLDEAVDPAPAPPEAPAEAPAPAPEANTANLTPTPEAEAPAADPAA